MRLPRGWTLACAATLVAATAALLAGEEEGDGKHKAKPKPKPHPQPAAAQKQSSPEVRYLVDLAAVHRRYGHIEEALPLLKKALEAETDAEQRIGLLQLAGETALADHTRAAEAAACFQEAIKLTDDDEKKCVLLLWLGGSYRTAKDYAKAEAAFWSAHKVFKDERQKQDALRQFLEVVKREDRIEAATAEYEKKHSDAPGEADPLEILAILYTQGPKKDNARALEIYEKLAQMHPEDLAILQKLAALYQQNKQPEKAVEYYRKVVEKKPGELEKLAKALMAAGQKDEALATARKLYEGKEDDPKALEEVAKLLDQFGEKAEALALREKALSHVTDPKERTETRFRLADQYRLAKSYEKAESLLRAILTECGQTQPPADLKEDEKKKFEEELNAAIARAKKALFQLYEEQGKLEELKF